MTGWKIFSHSVFLLNHNLKDALRISSPMILVMVLSFILGGASAVDSIPNGGSSDGGSSMLLQLLTGFAGFWVAVAWHRFVLLEERGGGVPAFHAGPVLTYFLVALLLAGILVLVGGGAGAVVGMTFGFSSALFMIGVCALLLFLFWVFYRLSPMLPAAALGKPMGPVRAWAETTELSGAILVSGLMLVFFSFLGAALAALVLFQVSILLGLLFAGVLQWAYTMVGISILTTIYGITIEGREI